MNKKKQNENDEISQSFHYINEIEYLFGWEQRQILENTKEILMNILNREKKINSIK